MGYGDTYSACMILFKSRLELIIIQLVPFPFYLALWLVSLKLPIPLPMGKYPIAIYCIYTDWHLCSWTPSLFGSLLCFNYLQLRFEWLYAIVPRHRVWYVWRGMSWWPIYNTWHLEILVEEMRNHSTDEDDILFSVRTTAVLMMYLIIKVLMPERCECLGSTGCDYWRDACQRNWYGKYNG